MTDLSKVVFLADCLEPGRPDDYTDAIWKAFRKSGGGNLDRAVAVACDLNLRVLLDAHKLIHPLTVEVRNYYLQLSARFSHKT